MAESPNFLRTVYPYASFPRLVLEPGIAHPIWITDTTLRDGQQGAGPFAKEHMVAVYRFLHRLGGPKGIVRQTEMFVQLQEDRRAIEACIELGLPFPKVVGWVRPNEADLVWAKRLGLLEVGVLMSVSDNHIYRKLRKDRKSVRETYRRSLVQALEMGLDVSLHLEDVTRSDVYDFLVPFLQEVRRLQDEAGKPVGVRLCDTLGLGVPLDRTPLPRGVPALVRTALEEVGLSSEQLEWHGHNDFHMAQANALAAWASGCSGVNGTFFGVGERAGNTPIDALVLAYIGLKGDEDGMEPGVLSEAAAYFQGTMGVSIPGRYPLFGKEALRTKAGIHAYGMLNDEETYSAFDTHALLGLKPSVTVSKTSGVSGLAQWINAHFGLEGDLCLTKETKEVREVFRAIKESYEAGRVSDYQDAEVLEMVEVHAPGLYRRLMGLQQDGRGATGDIDSQPGGKDGANERD